MYKTAFVLVAFGAACCPAAPARAAEWHRVAGEPDRRYEVDRASIRDAEAGRKTAWSRTVTTPDEARRGGYMIIRTFSRYDCAAKTVMPVRREYLSAQLVVVRDEAVSDGKEVPVKTGVDQKVFDAVCRPAAPDAKKEAEDAARSAAARREAARSRDESNLGAAAPRAARRRPASHGAVPWGYQGAGGPRHWAKLKPEYAACGSGRRQSPIDIRDGVPLDLPPVVFDYRTAPLRIIDNGHTVQVNYPPGSRIQVLGRDYELVQFHFHKPAEERVEGRAYDMAAHLVHRDETGRLAVVTVLFDTGADNATVQTLWNNLPLEPHVEIAPADVVIDAARLLPAARSYFAYMGSLTTPPCTEGVLSIVLKTPLQVSAQQLAVLARLYPMNARPIQPANGRLIKQSR